MSVIGPRPGLWNQDILTAERDKYNANDVKPGLTGWAQINGRDEIEISEKAKLDGEYVSKMGLWMDIKCFLTIRTVGYLVTSVYKIAILIFQKSIYWFAFTNTLDMIIAFILLSVMYRKSGGQKLSFNLKTGTKMLKVSYNFIISGLMVAVYAQMDKVMLGQRLLFIVFRI